VDEEEACECRPLLCEEVYYLVIARSRRGSGRMGGGVGRVRVSVDLVYYP
jgi:hypothetical protein